jgi:ribosome maturation factor RimP
MKIEERTQIAQQLLEQVLAPQPEYFVLEVKVKPFRNGFIVVAFIDTDTGISIEECSQVSRLYEQALENSPAFEQLYRLDVSSPGIDRPLVPRQFLRNTGKKIEIKINEQEKYLGKLVEANQTEFTIEVPANKKKKTPAFQKTFSYSEIQSAKIIL